MRKMNAKYGQHFLVNEGVIAQIVHAALKLRAENVVEIGPGKGALTLALAAAGLRGFTAAEIDPDMIAYLQRHLPPEADVRIWPGDFLKADLTALPPVPTEFVSNLPYVDAAAILDKVLSFAHFSSAVFMFQKEQANRIQAKTGTEFYGPLSIFSQARAQIALLCNVSRGCFNPPPKVQSAVLTFTRLKNPPVRTEEWPAFKKLVAAAFLHRRKTVYNALLLAGYEKSAAGLALERAGVSVTARAEQIGLEQFVLLCRLLRGGI